MMQPAFIPVEDEYPPTLKGALPTISVSYTHLRAHETVLDLVCRLLLEKKKQYTQDKHTTHHAEPHRDL